MLFLWLCTVQYVCLYTYVYNHILCMWVCVHTNTNNYICIGIKFLFSVFWCFLSVIRELHLISNRFFDLFLSQTWHLSRISCSSQRGKWEMIKSRLILILFMHGRDGGGCLWVCMGGVCLCFRVEWKSQAVNGNLCAWQAADVFGKKELADWCTGWLVKQINLSKVMPLRRQTERKIMAEEREGVPK